MGREAIVAPSAWRRLDWVALLVTVILVCVGFMMIYSAYEATRAERPESFLDNTVYRQMLFALLGLIVYAVCAALDYHVLLALHKWIYAGVIGMLLFTMVTGQARFGAQSWLSLERFGVQPSELCKVLMIVVLARRLDASEHNLERIWPFLLSGALVIVPVALIYVQPDFGIAAVLFFTWAGMVVLSGVRWRHLLLMGGAALASIPLLWANMKDYQRLRVIEFLNPGSDPTGSSYNITQALIGIGSGGWWGKGWLRGSQSQLHFLRVRHTDFIFSVLAEEFGFIGAILLLMLFAVLILRILRVASSAPDPAGRLLAIGVAAMLFVQTFINVGMNAQLVPVTGLTLPLISYGGSSLTTTLMALGIVQSVAVRVRRVEPSTLGMVRGDGW